MIRFDVQLEEDLPLALEALVLTATRYPARYEIGPFDDAELLVNKQVYVTGADEVEAAQVLVQAFGDLGVAWTAT